MSVEIHDLAYVHPDAAIAEGVEIGPFSYIGPKVTIGEGTRVMNNVTIVGKTTIGKGNKMFPTVVIGCEPQDLKYEGEDSLLIIGDKNSFREGVTIHPGTRVGGNRTVIGNNNLIMGNCHIAHDCILEDNIIMANGVLLGGHVKVESYATFGGMAVAHHFATIGKMAFIGGVSAVSKDAPPFMTIAGNPSRVWCVNQVGLRRRGLSGESVNAIKDAYRTIWRTSNGNRSQLLSEIETSGNLDPEVDYLIQFLRASEQGRQGRAREGTRIES